jgi:hypothetical protein
VELGDGVVRVQVTALQAAEVLRLQKLVCLAGTSWDFQEAG